MPIFKDTFFIFYGNNNKGIKLKNSKKEGKI